ncbi:MAG TPA: 30S ribosomal protein S8 [Candidatus Caccopulliclostridium gallistercoris]|uniref:Small ribosomal subunit protein uS8 n=1 Tax=Candidatus Caccopulliclostridium gallistercoris TaxID=2840719 RepID=A0A9D1ND75_9FIRM|nr:30S ribosomal protein S8 [Candidatus Caccopulliclostridium gallistercoris]
MIVTDPIADMLTRIRNAITAKHDIVLVPASKEKLTIADILMKEGYIVSAEVEDSDSAQKFIKIVLKYAPNGESVIKGLKRISKPGLRVYAGVDNLPKVISGLGIAIVSTNKGILTDKQARSQGVGGEVLAYVW